MNKYSFEVGRWIDTSEIHIRWTFSGFIAFLNKIIIVQTQQLSRHQ